ncbi:hypothetical protein SAMN06295967_1211 [Belliella buryatensis]|uniref:EpsG family protein n=1 Tax=Belliella buryatensis TaxID=1500549 RepID=A0A239GXS7_9BACT|nr:hypothetical protein [Belliella buryatensis]SNS74016.1 hypothetical protein SAMN06295967_1211 [Belliella buryatensis]
MLDILVIIAVIIALANTNSSMAKKFGLSAKLTMHLNYLLFYHLFFSLFFTWYILNFGGDSQGYWRFGMQQVLIKGEESLVSYWGTSTTFILWLCYIPAKVLGLSYITGNILFGALGFVGIRYIYILVAVHFPMNHKVLNIPLFPTVFYFLNLHFWTAGVGKDAICFWGIAWFLFALQQYKSRWWQAVIALFFVYMARPHMGQALIGGATLAIFLGSEMKVYFKIVMGIVAILGTYLLLDSTAEFLRVEELTIEALTGKSEMTARNLSGRSVGSALDITGYSLPMKLFTYLFRPLFVDAHNFVAFFSSFENALYLWLSFFIYRNWTPEAIRDMPLFLKAGIITFVPVTLAFMNALSNLGVIMRMKNMTMIYFLLFCFFLIAYNKKLRYQRAQEKIRYYQQREEIIASKKQREIIPDK